MIRGMGITWTHIQSVWNHSGPSEGPYSANQTGQELFFAVSYGKRPLVSEMNITKKMTSNVILNNISYLEIRFIHYT